MAQNEYNKSTVAAGDDVEAAGRRMMKQQYQGKRQTMIKEAKNHRGQYCSPRRSKARQEKLWNSVELFLWYGT